MPSGKNFNFTNRELKYGCFPANYFRTSTPINEKMFVFILPFVAAS